MDEAQMLERVPGAVIVCTGHLEDHEFLFSGYSVTWEGAVANVRRKKGARVFGVLYELPRGGLTVLDRYEGYPRSYQRKSGRIATPDGPVSAVLYYKRQTSFEVPPNPVYVRKIVAAVRRHGG
jgi:gamma-glutamylcyclotransferase (GGCT)/AIG2-like uncharacterized protein YtfP